MSGDIVSNARKNARAIYLEELSLREMVVEILDDMLVCEFMDLLESM